MIFVPNLLKDPISFAPKGGQGKSVGRLKSSGAKPDSFGRGLTVGVANSGLFIGASGG
tara:strand:+ start:648 stop:821 length:174 start_codon:yes stop_codon:yes gene_type:complete